MFHYESSGAEWIMAAVLLMFFLTFIKEFQKMRAKLPTFVTMTDELPIPESLGGDEPLIRASSI
jgi:hypothetical protein